MAFVQTLYLVVTGGATAYRAATLLPDLLQVAERVITLQTPNSLQLVSPLTLARVPGNQVVSSYLDQALQPRAPVGSVLVAPCSFNTLNKLARGIADNLALSVTAEMIGLRQRVVVAVSLNAGLWAHPAARASADTLRSWGVRIIEPQDDGSGLTMASSGVILDALAD